jgi:hypothetical protein
MREPEPTVELHQRWPEGGAWSQRRDPAVLRSDARPGRAVRDSGSRLIVAIAAGVAFTVGLYGIAANRDLVAAIGLCAVGLTALALKAAAGIRVQALKRRCKLLGRARAESERARHDLERENAELRRRNAELESREAAVNDGFDWVDEQASGRLRALLDQAGLELADLTDMVLDDEEEQS